MINSNNLHLVKRELANLNELIEHYKEAFHAYYRELTDDETKDREYAHYDEKNKGIMAYLHPVYAWISQAESHLTDQLERATSKGSRWSSRASSHLSAREKERVHVAELKAERSLLKQKKALRAAEEDLELELEIVKAEARRKVLEELYRTHNPPLPCASSPPSVAASFTPIVIPSVSAPLPNEVALKPEAFVSTTQTTVTMETQVKAALQGPRISAATGSIVKNSPFNPKAAEFTPTTVADGTSSTPYTGHGLKNSKEIGHGISEI
ncbi:hypothetical protein P5673_014392 [Acropora cervicornis]|uniref:Uncharacterized protein n=1 Tax=Acropora cervicornis TaxID=6130 RepID=A0AAD9QKN3_ACRCE|nr:hypothetical protein P5673_014392 [Acropora cervicornis]